MKEKMKNYEDVSALDILEELVYIMDLHNFDMLYMNEKARNSFNIKHSEYAGKKCYEILRKFDAPCSFCGAKGMSLDEPARWLSHNKVIEEYHQVQDTPLLYKGRVARLEMSTDITMEILQRQRLKAALDTETAMLEAIHIVNKYSNIEEGLNRMLEYIGICFGARRSFIYELCGEEFVNTYEWRRIDNKSEISLGHTFPMKNIQNWMSVLQNHMAVCVNDVMTVNNSHEYPELKKYGIKAYIIAPLERDGRLVGFMGMDEPFVERMESLSAMMITLAYFASLSITGAESREALERFSYNDTMTNVANRNAYIRDLHSYNENLSLTFKKVGIVYCDLNGLKKVNDSLGHDAGDAIIIRLAETICSCFRRDEVYRIGGDEFLVIVTDITKDNFYNRVEELKHKVEEEMVSVSIGTEWSETGTKIEEMVKAADKVMYKEKQQYYQSRG